MTLTARGDWRDGLAEELVAAVEKRRCAVLECHIAPLGQRLNAALLVCGDWSALGKLESALPGIADELVLECDVTHTEAAPLAEDYRPYAAEIVAPQQAQLLGTLFAFFRNQGVRVTELGAQAYDASQTGAALCNVHMAVQVPIKQHPQALREAFMDICDELHADGMLDPIKS